MGPYSDPKQERIETSNGKLWLRRGALLIMAMLLVWSIWSSLGVGDLVATTTAKSHDDAQLILDEAIEGSVLGFLLPVDVSLLLCVLAAVIVQAVILFALPRRRLITGLSLTAFGGILLTFGLSFLKVSTFVPLFISGTGVLFHDLDQRQMQESDVEVLASEVWDQTTSPQIARLQIRNSSGVPWQSAEFEVDFVDADGNSCETLPVEVEYLAPGQDTSIVMERHEYSECIDATLRVQGLHYDLDSRSEIAQEDYVRSPLVSAIDPRPRVESIVDGAPALAPAADEGLAETVEVEDFVTDVKIYRLPDFSSRYNYGITGVAGSEVSRLKFLMVLADGTVESVQAEDPVDGIFQTGEISQDEPPREWILWEVDGVEVGPTIAGTRGAYDESTAEAWASPGFKGDSDAQSGATGDQSAESIFSEVKIVEDPFGPSYANITVEGKVSDESVTSVSFVLYTEDGEALDNVLTARVYEGGKFKAHHHSPVELGRYKKWVLVSVNGGPVPKGVPDTKG
ncbi:hypothetical protein M3B90_02130 [Dermabacter sp. p3-SID358]|uniref:hypothetical protein n=1 Tax=Dermabacter sp. p3-SID358 TaxID=2916114 RepID=UPI0021A57739|nr:hypothetical protein [Dermabacter sp. p3-SID358]MCT1866330.1 hypothetical protein [Dermabacter sp. p3-SID358]